MWASAAADRLYAVTRNNFIATVVSIFVIGLSSEIIGLSLNLWSYPGEFLPVRVVIGWVIIGGFILWFVRSFDDYIEKVFYREKFV